jgi:ankyrin
MKERMNSIDKELVVAAKGGNNLAEVRRLLTVGANVNAKDTDGDTPLHETCFYGHVQVVVELLEHGADTEAKTISGRTEGWTPLHEASRWGYSLVVKELVDHGADIETKSFLDRTALHFACSQGDLAVGNELLSPNASNGTTTILGKRKSHGGASIQAKDIYDDTPLHDASHNAHLPVVKVLLSGGVNLLAANTKSSP